jgi:hypothetical protein
MACGVMRVFFLATLATGEFAVSTAPRWIPNVIISDHVSNS